MKGIIIRQPGGPEVLKLEEGLPEPVCQAGHVKIRVYAVGVNHGLDTLAARGAFGAVGTQSSEAFPRIPGADLAGVVEEVGAGVSKVQPGDRVLSSVLVTCNKCRYCLSGRENACPYQQIVGVHRDGGAAESALLPERNVWPIPEGLSFIEAAAIPVSFGTAWQMLVDCADVNADDWVLVVSAGSGLGVAGIQIAKLFGARVIAAAGSDWKLERAKELGADAVVNYSTEPLGERIREITQGEGVDIVFDGGINQNGWESYKDAISLYGRIVICGTIGGGDGKLNLDIRQYYRRYQSFIGSAGYTAESYSRLLRQLGAKRLKPVIHKVLPLAQMAEAHAMLNRREVFGKVVLQVREDGK